MHDLATLELEAPEARAMSRDTLLGELGCHRMSVAVHHMGAELRIVFCRDADEGGLALRVPLFTANARCSAKAPGRAIEVVCRSELGVHRVTVESRSPQLEDFTCRVVFTPTRDLHLPFLPRDLVIFDARGRAERTAGKVEAVQRRLNTGLCYFDATRPGLGKVLYVQDFGALGDYFEATGTTPESTVGGQWPELGYLAPTKPGEPDSALRAGAEVTLSCCHLVFREGAGLKESESAWQFLDMLGAVYPVINKPALVYRDWTARAEATLRDLSRSRKARTRHFGEVYFHPYTATENPDSMVQLTLFVAINEWSRWSGARHPLERQIRRGLKRFYDGDLGTMRRYLPDVGKEKDADAVDSWYLYHPLLSLATLARAGDAEARRLFDASIDFGVRAARHFKYRWPIQFKFNTFKVITATAPADDRGQTDVGGLYAWVMLEAFELTDDPRYLSEARAAIDAAEGMGFALNYQANLTAWGAAACIRLWRITGRKHYLAQSYVYLASFFHNSAMWESRIAHAKHYTNFLGVTCLQDAPYMAMYECFDSFAAFERYLDFGGPDLIASAKQLVTDYCRFALERAWSYYPDALPPEALATDNRNGHIDRKLSFPLEDLYVDGQPAGQVGQEIYGAGGAMVFATRAFHRIEGAPFLLHCDHFIRAMTRIDACSIAFAIDGIPGTRADVRVVKLGRKALPHASLRCAALGNITPAEHTREAILFCPPAQGQMTLSWAPGAADAPS